MIMIYLLYVYNGMIMGYLLGSIGITWCRVIPRPSPMAMVVSRGHGGTPIRSSQSKIGIFHVIFHIIHFRLGFSENP